MKDLGASIVDPADLLMGPSERKQLVETLNARFLMEFPYTMDRYLETLVECKIRSTAELAAFNDVSDTSYETELKLASRSRRRPALLSGPHRIRPRGTAIRILTTCRYDSQNQRSRGESRFTGSL